MATTLNVDGGQRSAYQNTSLTVLMSVLMGIHRVSMADGNVLLVW